MSIPNHLATTEVVLLEVEIFITIIAIGAWGGFVSYLIRRDKQEGDDHSHKGIMHCLTQVVVSCFTSFLLSAVAIEKELSFNMLLAAGLGGVFAGPILKILGEKIKKALENAKIH